MAATPRNGAPGNPPWRLAGPRRVEERVQATLQLMLPTGASGLTRDISPSGIFFWTEHPLEQGDPVRFSVRFHDTQMKRRWTLHCSARVLRVEQEAGQCGVAARILESRLETFA
jgi:PilZ domain